MNKAGFTTHTLVPGIFLTDKFRSCDIFSGFCDTALLMFGVFELILP